MQCARGKYYMLNCNDGRQRPMFEIHPRSAAFPLPMALVIEEVAASLISHQACHQVQLQALLYPGSAESSLTATLDY